jgi:hypothetical protein
MRAMFLAYFCCRTSLYRYMKDAWCLALRKSMAANIYLRNGTLFKTFVGLFYLKSSPMYDSVFNTRQLNIEAASVGGLFLNLDIWLVAVGYVESHC